MYIYYTCTLSAVKPASKLILGRYSLANCKGLE